MNISLKKVVSSFVLLIVILTTFLFFYLQKQYIKKVDSVVFFNSTQSLEEVMKSEAASISNAIAVVYFWRSSCPCNITVLPHFYQLMEKYSSQGVTFLLADISPSSGGAPTDIPAISRRQLELVKKSIDYTPAVAIWSGDGQLIYYGPHNLGLVCNADTSFIQKALDNLLDGNITFNTNTLGEGCFCEN